MSASVSLFDSSVWVALAFDSHPRHAEARRAFEASDSDHPVAFCRATQQSFLRLLTTPAVQKLFSSPPISNHEAWKVWEELARMPQVAWLEEPPALESLWKKHAGLSSASPKVWMDAYLASFSQRHAVELVTLDRDFKNFKGASVRYI